MTRQLTIKSVDDVIAPAAFAEFAHELGVEPSRAPQRLAAELAVLVGYLHVVAVLAEHAENGVGERESLEDRLAGMRDLIDDGLERARTLHSACLAIARSTEEATS